MTTAHWIGLLLVIYAGISALWSPVFVETLDAVAKFTILALAFLIGAETKDARGVYSAMSLGIAVNGVVAIAQSLGWQGVEQVVSPAGFYANKNFLGEIAALCVVSSLASRSWWLVPGPVCSLVLTECRGAMAGVAVAGIAWTWKRSRLAAFGLILACACGSFAALHSPTFRSTLLVRVNITLDAVENLTWMGHGIGSYWVSTPQHAPRQEAMNTRHWHAHDDMLEAVYEYGLASFLVVAFALYCLGGPFELERLILIAFMVEGLFGFPLHTPATGFMAAIAAGRIARGRYDLRGILDVRADACRDWIADRIRQVCKYRSATPGDARLSA